MSNLKTDFYIPYMQLIFFLKLLVNLRFFLLLALVPTSPSDLQEYMHDVSASEKSFSQVAKTNLKYDELNFLIQVLQLNYKNIKFISGIINRFYVFSYK